MLLSKQDFERALKSLKQGGIVAYPTETFYGLAVDSNNEKAITALYHLKKRDPHKPLSLIVPDVESISKFVSSIPEVYHELIDSFWPGPLTLIFPVNKKLSPLLIGGGDSVAIRVSSHPVAQTLCSEWGAALTATSANLSGHQPLNTALDVKRLWGKQISYILDGGKTRGGQGSTIIQCSDTEKKCYVEREGVIDISKLKQHLPSNYIVCKV
ncbi:MAG: threonylcarbamoyl-AMP synthase [Desulfocapsa sp.]|nr:threonylcarbamoyl-AMP synthase [Desulfocapsa sp.]